MDPENDDDLLELDGFEAEDDLPAADAGEMDDDQGDDEPDDAIEGENAVIRQMRAELRKTKREAAELRKRVEPPPKDIGPRPRYGDGSAWGYDEDKCDAAIDEWEANLRASLTRPAQTSQQDTAAEFDRRSSQFTAVEMRHRAEPAKAKALDDVADALGSQALATITWVAADKGPDILLKLARDPDLMDRVADIADDPIMLAAEIGRLSAGVKTVPKPDIDKPVRGGRAAPAQRGDARLKALEDKARASGDYGPLMAYKRQMRERGKV